MTKTALRWLRRKLVVGTALLAACADQAPLGPDRRPELPAHLATMGDVAPELGACDKLRAPAGTELAFHAYAKGVQKYRYNGTSWLPAGPRADLFADAQGRAKVGTHYSGPTWESLSGSKVGGAVHDLCTVDPNAIPWLSLDAVPGSNKGPGVFESVTFIQRLNTVGGKAPSVAGALDEVREIPYTAEYFFYQSEN